MHSRSDDAVMHLRGTRDRRESRRLLTRFAGLLHSSDDPCAPDPVELHDVSATGVGFSSARELTIGQSVVLTLQSTDNSNPPERLHAVVVWTVSREDVERCRVGCHWRRPLNDDELTRIT